MRRPRSGDRGSVLLLTVFLGLVLAGVVAVVVDASAVFLAHRALASQADGAALAAAQEVDLDAFYAGDGDVLPLAGAADVVSRYVADHPGTAVVDVRTDGTTVTVVLERHVPLPLAPPGYRDGVTVTARASARLVRAS